MSTPLSSLHVALFDADFSEVDADDALGRVSLPLAQLHPDTVYTAWLPLHITADDDVYGAGNHRHGAVRLRYCVRWASNRARVVGYLVPPPPTIMRFRSDADLKLARFTCEGRPVDRKYSREVRGAQPTHLRHRLWWPLSPLPKPLCLAKPIVSTPSGA